MNLFIGNPLQEKGHTHTHTQKKGQVYKVNFAVRHPRFSSRNPETQGPEMGRVAPVSCIGLVHHVPCGDSEASPVACQTRSPPSRPRHPTASTRTPKIQFWRFRPLSSTIHRQSRLQRTARNVVGESPVASHHQFYEGAGAGGAGCRRSVLFHTARGRY